MIIGHVDFLFGFNSLSFFVWPGCQFLRPRYFSGGINVANFRACFGELIQAPLMVFLRPLSDRFTVFNAFLVNNFDDLWGQFFTRLIVHVQIDLNHSAEISNRVVATFNRFMKLQFKIGVWKQNDRFAHTGLHLLSRFWNGHTNRDTGNNPRKVGSRRQYFAAFQIFKFFSVKGA